jgi:hypothetical protein
MDGFDVSEHIAHQALSSWRIDFELSAIRKLAAATKSYLHRELISLADDD